MLPLVRLGMAISGQRIARNYPATAMLIVPVVFTLPCPTIDQHIAGGGCYIRPIMSTLR
jgi:hypothetical protein